MGSDTFYTRAVGANAKEAFAAAVEDAKYMNGHGGYTGTIAEKRSFVVIDRKPVPIDTARMIANDLIERGDPRIDDKWGDAGCIELLPDPKAEDRAVRGGKKMREFFFFGWASS